MRTNKRCVFKGAATALVTPFSDGAVDYDAFGKMIDYQLDGGINAVVVAGTTGESPTLTESERRKMTRYAKDRIGGKVPLIVGCGSNDASAMLENSKNAATDGADALLLVTPYYNKATDLGLERNFLSIADKTDLPIILYNVPSRTGVDIPVPVYRSLAEHENIVAVKEASGNIGKIAEIIAETDGKLGVYSGNDDQTVPVMSLGGIGVISVLSNIMPRETVEMCRACLAGRTDVAAKRQLDLLPLIRSLFSEVNPIPVKTALAVMGLCKEEFRLPMCEMNEANKIGLIRLMKKYKLI